MFVWFKIMIWSGRTKFSTKIYILKIALEARKGFWNFNFFFAREKLKLFRDGDF